MNELNKGLESSLKLLNTHGRLVVVSFHGLEDQAVSDFAQKHRSSLLPLHTSYIAPSETEIEENNRSRSARLRAYERIE